MRMLIIDGIDAARVIVSWFADVKPIGMPTYDDCDYGEKIRQSDAWGHIDFAGVLADIDFRATNAGTLDISTSAINPAVGNFYVFDGVDQIIAKKSYFQKCEYDLELGAIG